MSIEEHKKETLHVNVMVITISDTRTKETDKSGQKMMELLRNHGHRIVSYTIIPDEEDIMKQTILEACQNPKVQVILMNGGTGIAKRDVTFEVLHSIIERTIPGFGELFRMLSYEEIGSSAMLSRAMAGIIQNTVIFSTPGSTKAVTLAMEKLIIPELSHIVREINK